MEVFNDSGIANTPCSCIGYVVCPVLGLILHIVLRVWSISVYRVGLFHSLHRINGIGSILLSFITASGANAHSQLLMRKQIFAAFMLLAASVAFISCSKDENQGTESGEEVTLIGTWTSYCVDEFGELGEFVDREPNTSYSVVFTETEAAIAIGDMPNVTVEYEISEDDNTVITFPSVYADYGMQLVAQFKDGELAIQQRNQYWDFSYVYRFKKQ